MRGSINLHIYFFWSFTLFSFFSNIVTSVNTLTAIQSLEINQTLVSPNQVFEFGFFRPSTSRWYLGIWYKDIPERIVVWVANRDTPLENSNGTLKIGDNGDLVLLNQTGKSIWSSNETTATNPVIQILDSGNLILIEANEKNTSNYLWQSFDYPTDTLLPGMKLGRNLETGMEHRLTSWKSLDDPSSGDFSYRMEYHGLPEFFLRNKQIKEYRSGPWNGLIFSALPVLSSNFILQDNMSFDATEVYYFISKVNNSKHTRLAMNWTGEIQRHVWVESSQSWNKLWYAPNDECDKYVRCGPFGICDSSAFPVCSCIQGFHAKNQVEWNLRDFSEGCVRNTGLDCGKDKFLRVQHVELPETTIVFVNMSMTLNDCEDMCMKNCSCTAFANVEITNGGTGCVMWTDELLDMRQFAAGGQDLYVRLAASDVVDHTGSAGSSDKKNNVGRVVGITVTTATVILGVSMYCLWKRRKLQSIWKWKTIQKGITKLKSIIRNQHPEVTFRDPSGERNMDDLELPLFDFNTITMATNNFSEANELGQGGFGCVYRGRLVDGQEIAVKRLSKTSGQGIEEFKNEVKSIAKLQHRNLVRLFGCCVEKDEQMLVYEYMENNSLDSILFDKAKCSLLDWQIRFNIICGIARGLLYLHQDSRLRIIHRDLKGSNVLLDREMNPKISDFGMARIFGSDQTQANTRRVVGTYGYMSPEYAMDGLFSVKSDVFSFGVLVLEIISGKKNRGFYLSEESNLLGNSWKHWKEGKALELIDSSFANSYSASEVLRCIHVGLICVQERAEDRPTISSVVLMLGSETASMPQPKNPGFVLGKSPTDTDSSAKQEESYTVNQVTITDVDAR
ncbi:receptor-like serine/threonine-protein kinase SD1-8 isoform X3 [Gastrolobium bilobum]|uniref:receptor-like serine/threonine-protein kinase SD1-8 isoform X3 n=1 Tax=Gastrolobium bilobum TaxID=150636 RepID=UPI002AB2A620|nr:receptor-like serine/threonine-protein kinase SD1-8 isoform X3 [Gastrolobium bilobum]